MKPYSRPWKGLMSALGHPSAIRPRSGTACFVGLPLFVRARDSMHHNSSQCAARRRCSTGQHAAPGIGIVVGYRYPTRIAGLARGGGGRWIALARAASLDGSLVVVGEAATLGPTSRCLIIIQFSTPVCKAFGCEIPAISEQWPAHLFPLRASMSRSSPFSRRTRNLTKKRM